MEQVESTWGRKDGVTQRSNSPIGKRRFGKKIMSWVWRPINFEVLVGPPKGIAQLCGRSVGAGSGGTSVQRQRRQNTLLWQGYFPK